MEVSAQDELEQEIVSENVRMVRGDGVETASGRQGVDKEMEEEEQADKTDDEEDRSSQEECSSWGRTRSKSVLHPLTRVSAADKNTKMTVQEGPTVARPRPSVRVNRTLPPRPRERLAPLS